jgi:hypothetical protein
MGFFFPYMFGMFLGIQIGKQQSPTYTYLMHKYNKVNTDYYKNHQMNYRFNK